MARVKRGNAARNKRKKLRKEAKGFRGSLKKQTKRRKQAILKSRKHATRHRKEKKRTFRRLWIARIAAAAKLIGTSYSRLIDGLNKAKIKINRKSLSEIAIFDPATFKKLAEKTKAKK